MFVTHCRKTKTEAPDSINVFKISLTLAIKGDEAYAVPGRPVFHRSPVCEKKVNLLMNSGTPRPSPLSITYAARVPISSLSFDGNRGERTHESNCVAFPSFPMTLHIFQLRDSL